MGKVKDVESVNEKGLKTFLMLGGNKDLLPSNA